MKKGSIVKVLATFTLMIVSMSFFSGCRRNPNSTDSSETKNVNNQSLVTTNIESKSTDSTVPTDITIADLSFLCDSPNEVVVSSRTYNNKEYKNPDENGPNFCEGDIDIIDTGSNYLLGVAEVNYRFGVISHKYRAFIESAVEQESVTKDEDGRNTLHYKIIKGKEVLNCMGEKFTLVSYTVNDMGRGTCEFAGSDGKKYYLYNDISSNYNEFTGEWFFEIVTEPGKPAYKEITFDEGTYIKIPYNMAEGTEMKRFVNNSPDWNSGDPVGCYCMQFDSNGNVVKNQGR